MAMAAVGLRELLPRLVLPTTRATTRAGTTRSQRSTRVRAWLMGVLVSMVVDSVWVEGFGFRFRFGDSTKCHAFLDDLLRFVFLQE